MSSPYSSASYPPFSPAEAKAARLRIGLSHGHVCAHLAQLGLHRPPETILAWESGAARPTEAELFALADALWCPTPILMAVRPRTLREHRLARQFTAERLARRIGMPVEAYARAETDHHWTGTDHQTLLLADALGLAPAEVPAVAGLAGELVGLLRQAVEGRWKQYAAPLAQLARLDEGRVAGALRTLHQEYAAFNERYLGHLVARTGDERLREIATDRAAWLRTLPDRFRHLTEGD
ncbi:helix-turn-helix transcriptional regulator [Streptomyces sp. RerS4]|uniref:helix-turn-helix domain-containing protein n=1 Tax=Streptomyces sp. RerS4 TaxID=2942449 RepID=UPI00201C7DE2|nr:helix-turn-helix transcriptional regulator [Streptomyces sp. RerS4]UQX03702.1 helix-turn-helix transcriptional regulator [Streptomyces sp. RerS4]